MRIQTLGLIFWMTVFPLAVFSQTVSHLNVELLSETPALTPGKPVTLGIHFTMAKDWHIYWQNPGDAGLATSITWKLPVGFRAGKILWPFPQAIPLPSVMDYGYENEVLLMTPVSVPKNLKPGELFKFSAKVKWLVCKDICVPGQATVRLEIPVAANALLKNTVNPLFAENHQRLPSRLPVSWKPAGTLDNRQFQLTFQTGASYTHAYFFPLIPNQINNSAPQNFQATVSGFTLTLKRSDQLLENVQILEGLLVVENHGNKTGYETAIPLSKLN